MEDVYSTGEIIEERSSASKSTNKVEGRLKQIERDEKPLPKGDKSKRHIPSSSISLGDGNYAMDSLVDTRVATDTVTLSPIEEDDNSIHSQTSSNVDSQTKDEFPQIDDKCAISILEGLIKGEYDDNIHELWSTVNSSQFNVVDNGVTFPSFPDM